MRNGTQLLQLTRIFVSNLFHRFGIHCATHQIRIILISCVVITSLFYPALAQYSSSQLLFSKSILDSFAASSLAHAHADLADVWARHDALRVRDDAVSRARCGVERTLRVERVLVQGAPAADAGALHAPLLLAALELEARIARALALRGTPCLRRPGADPGVGGACLVLSPLAFWGHDAARVRTDRQLLATLVGGNASAAGVALAPETVLAGRGASEPMGAAFDFAEFLALTYFFPETDCLGGAAHAAWLQVVEEAAAERGEVLAQAKEPTLIALEYDPDLLRNKGFSAISAFLYIAYLTFGAYVTWTMRRMDAIHSRIGVTFTALVEIAVSTITSLSVCALVGFKVTMVPWGMLPIVIVFVGAENMFNLVDAVQRTSVTLPVKERIAEGLSRAGTSNTLKVVSYNAILGVISVFSAGAIRQFCVFAIVVLVAHWFLAHTFFLAVLSIDLQRLELDDILRQNSTIAPPLPDNFKKDTTKPLSIWQKLVSVTLRGRATKNISLLLLLAITATLYYTTYPASANSRAPPIPTPRGPLTRPRVTTPTEVDQQTPALQIWRLFNPHEDPLLHLRIETPAILTFKPDLDPAAPPAPAHRLRPSRTFRLGIWLLDIVIIPITATTSALYALLLYLLKNAELLEAQRHRAEPDAGGEEEGALEGRIEFATLPRAFAADVELIAASADGRIVASVSLQNELVIWRTDAQTHIAIDVADVLLRGASTSAAESALTAVAVDDHGRYCAVGTGAGVTGVWSIFADSVLPLPHLCPAGASSRVVQLQFLSTSGRISRRSSAANSPITPVPAPTLVAIYNNGSVAQWAIGTLPTASYLSPSHPGTAVSTTLHRVHSDGQTVVAYHMDDGTVELAGLGTSHGMLISECYLPAGSHGDIATAVHTCRIDLDGGARLVVGIATESGTVSLWDALTCECIARLDECVGAVGSIHVAPVPATTCRTCGELPQESFALALSVDYVVRVFRAYLAATARRCSCAHSAPRRVPSRDNLGLGHRSRSSSAASAGAPPAPPTRTRLAAPFEPPPFPVSAHGVHSRRATEEARRAPDAPDDEPPAAAPWRALRVVAAADATCERGCWGVLGGRIAGVRRAARGVAGACGRDAPVGGLPRATLERWELWVLDPSTARVQSAPLARLARGAGEAAGGAVPRLPFTRVAPMLNARTRCLAGFGNTLGIFTLAGQ